MHASPQTVRKRVKNPRKLRGHGDGNKIIVMKDTPYIDSPIIADGNAHITKGVNIQNLSHLRHVHLLIVSFFDYIIFRSTQYVY